MPTYLVEANMYILLVIVIQGDVLCTVRTITVFFLFTVNCVGFAKSCSAFYKPQAMNNINDCAIQSLTRAYKNRDRYRQRREKER